jgi:uncharacterized membrane protein YphA (DoxX/SURF4 family)
MLIRRIARPMLSAAFISRGIDALRSPKPAADAARPALQGLSKLPDPVGTNVPSNAETVARVNAAVQIGGGLLLASGRLPRVAAAALALTVVPGSLGAHMFWRESDPQRKADERRAFLTDVSLIGGLIIAAVDTEGKPSLGWRGRRAARGREVAHVARERGAEWAEIARERAPELAETARERGAEFADVARTQVKERRSRWR